jgi:adenylate cyclase
VCLENARLFDDVLSMKNYNESILQSTSNGIITFDMDHKAVTANDAALSTLGLTRAQLIGKASTALFRRDNYWIADSLEQSRVTNRSSLAVDAEIARNGMEPASVNLTTAPLIDANDKNIGSMLVLEDITREKRVRSTMARYMSKEVADQLLEAGEEALVGKDQRVSVMFSDVRGFTSLAESVSARETVSMLNEYFTDMVDVIFANGGILDKYMGDAIMALFGAPFASDQDASNAVRAANEMMLALATLNKRRVERGGTALDIGIGISTGDVVVGNIGSNKRLEYTVIGDSVNLASRLEGANKFYGSKILFSEFTMKELESPRLIREVDKIRVKGKDKPVRIYETLIWREGEAGLEEMLGAYEEGRIAFAERDWIKAANAFEVAGKAFPGDTPSRLHFDRARQFALAPPAADWDGVWNLPGK